MSPPPPQTYFFEHAGRNLLAVFFGPGDRAAGDVGMVMMNGFGGDYAYARTRLTFFGRAMAARGVPSLRFDYSGYGDSDGAFTDSTPEQMKSDAEAAMAELARRSGCTRFILLGVRFGATLAAMIADGRSDIESLVLWEPVPQPWAYLYGELRKTVALQTRLFSAVRLTRDQIVANILGDRPSMVEGYDLNVVDMGFPLSKAMIEAMQKIDLVENPPSITARTLILHLDERPTPVPARVKTFASKLVERGTPCEVDTVVQDVALWRHGMFFTNASPEVYERTFAWLDRTEGAPDAKEPT
ncbi:MAG: alpha/beta fold hydrolase [Deltaproteobacteria bacterium]|nr:alpha/beta fold hydrolase [Deltaproteobacteria bacterium]